MEFPALTTYATDDPCTIKAVESFMKYFSVSDTEYLLAWANCSMWKNIFLKGGIFISLNYICFYAPVVTKNTSIWVSTNSDNYVLILIPFAEIKMITKMKNSLDAFGVSPNSIALPDAIKIETLTQEYYLTNFTDHKETFRFLNSLWVIYIDRMLEVVEYSERAKTKTNNFNSLYKKRSLSDWLAPVSNMKVDF
jgi:hypothetical protein